MVRAGGDALDHKETAPRMVVTRVPENRRQGAAVEIWSELVFEFDPDLT
jgi:hypothetical protein